MSRNDISKIQANGDLQPAADQHAGRVGNLKKSRPNFLLEPAGSSYPMIHLFDEPQFNTQDGYIGFMLDFFRKLRRGRTHGLSLRASE